MTDGVVTDADGTVTVTLEAAMRKAVVRVGALRWLIGWTRGVDARVWAQKRTQVPEVRWRLEADECAGELAVRVWLDSLGIDNVWNALFLGRIPDQGDVSARGVPVEVRTVRSPSKRQLWIFDREPERRPYVLAETTEWGVVRLLGWATKEHLASYGQHLDNEPRLVLDRDMLHLMGQLAERLGRRPPVERSPVSPRCFVGRWASTLNEGEPPALRGALHSEVMTPDAREVARWSVGMQVDLAALRDYFERHGWPLIERDELGALRLVLIQPRT